MATSISSIGIATDLQIVTGSTTIVGVSATSAAGATFYLRDGTDASGAIVFECLIPAAGGDVYSELPAIKIVTGHSWIESRPVM
jgi:hypothetical protein